MRSLLTVFFMFTFVVEVLAQEQVVDRQSPVHVESVQASFTQEKQLPILSRPILSKGQFVFKAPASLRWEYFSPIHTVLLMDDGQISKFVERNGSFIEEHGMGVDAMHIVLSEITGWLDGEITDTPTFQVQSKEDDLIILTPRKAELVKIISRIELKLLDQSGIMESVTLYEGPGSLTRMVFSGAVLNEKERKIPQKSFVKP
jgi:outer membrane lipoprotein-sorting protein